VISSITVKVTVYERYSKGCCRRSCHAIVNIEDNPGPNMRFDLDIITVIPSSGKVIWVYIGGGIHTVTEDSADMPIFCFNGCAFVGNTPTIVTST
jgi:hypothetical protein